jgi:hypothetical protein
MYTLLIAAITCLRFYMMRLDLQLKGVMIITRLMGGLSPKNHIK